MSATVVVIYVMHVKVLCKDNKQFHIEILRPLLNTGVSFAVVGTLSGTFGTNSFSSDEASTMIYCGTFETKSSFVLEWEHHRKLSTHTTDMTLASAALHSGEKIINYLKCSLINSKNQAILLHTL